MAAFASSGFSPAAFSPAAFDFGSIAIEEGSHGGGERVKTWSISDEDLELRQRVAKTVYAPDQNDEPQDAFPVGDDGLADLSGVFAGYSRGISGTSAGSHSHSELISDRAARAARNTATLVLGTQMKALQEQDDDAAMLMLAGLLLLDE